MAKKVLSFSYLPYYVLDQSTGLFTKEIFRPAIPVKLIFGEVVSYPFDALVDSGADRNLFPMSIAEEVGITFDNSKFPIIIRGIGNIKIEAFTKQITVLIGSKKYQTTADFSYEQRVPVLGRNGFFNLFKSIKFKEKERFLDIEFQD